MAYGEYISKTNLPTSKSKKAMGIASDMVNSWTFLDLSPEDNNILKTLERKRSKDEGRKSDLKMFLNQVLKDWWDQNRESFSDEVDEIIAESMKSEEDWKKEIEKIQKRQDKILALMDKAKMRTGISPEDSAKLDKMKKNE